MQHSSMEHQSLTTPLLQRVNYPSHRYAVDVLPPIEGPPLPTGLACLDVFCGIFILGMIISRDLSERFPVLGHAPWDGVQLGDLIIPGLFFAVGARAAWAYTSSGTKSSAAYRIIVRALQVFVLGVFLEGGFFHAVGDLAFGVSLTEIRISGFLQALAVAFLSVSLCHVSVSQPEPGTGERPDCCTLCSVLMYHWQAALLIAIGYLSLTFLLYVPDWEVPLPMQLQPAGALALSPNVTSLSVSCSVSGDLSPACNAAGYIDRSILGISHLYRLPSYRNLPDCVGAWRNDTPVPAWCLAPFEPSGLLSTIGGTMTAFLGLHFGHVLAQCEAHSSRLAHTLTLGLALSAAGWLLQYPFTLSLAALLNLDSLPAWLQISSPGMPLNLSLFSTSLALFGSGVSCLVLSVIYIFVDLAQVRFYTRLFEWSGKNWMFLYVMVVAPVLGTLLSGFYWVQPESNLVSAVQWLLSQAFQDPDTALIAGVMLKLLGCSFLCGLLEWQGFALAL